MHSISFKNDVNAYIKQEFAYIGNSDYKLTDLYQDLLNLFSVQEKVVLPFQRQVSISNELEERMKFNVKLSSQVNYLRNLLANGGNINPHQSKEVFNHFTPDPLISHWGIYHFHLDDKRTKHKYFKDRTKDLLFAYIDNVKALFIQVFPHKPITNFSDKILLEILDKNWPDVLLEMNGVIGLSQNNSAEERHRLRKSNLNEGGLEVNGKFVFSPNIGVMMSGHSVQAARTAMQFSNWIKKNEAALNDDLKGISESLAKMHAIDHPIQFGFKFLPAGPAIIDTISGTVLIRYDQILEHLKEIQNT